MFKPMYRLIRKVLRYFFGYEDLEHRINTLIGTNSTITRQDLDLLDYSIQDLEVRLVRLYNSLDERIKELESKLENRS